MNRFGRTLALCVLLLMLAACQNAPITTEAPLPGVQARQLATVYISPTPDDAQRYATEAFSQPQLTAIATQPAVTATVYMGVFLQPAENPDNEIPLWDATQVFDLIPGLATARPSRCQITVDATFGDMWRSETRGSQALGCPIEPALQFEGTVQTFERGAMYYQPGGAFWVIEATNDGFPDRHWTITQQLPPVESISADIQVPDGLRIPQQGFASVWFGVDGVRDTLGFARTGEQKVVLVYQRFENGALFSDSSTGITFILLNDGQSYGPF